jgi:hypothetical protein
MSDDGITLQSASHPDPNEDLIVWCRTGIERAAAELRDGGGGDDADFLLRLARAYLLLVDTDLNEAALETYEHVGVGVTSDGQFVRFKDGKIIGPA